MVWGNVRRHKTENKNVLIGVLKSKRDLDILLNEHWYRIPYVHMPKKRFEYLAFYQPAMFGTVSNRIQYYARVRTRRIYNRSRLLPVESAHPNANKAYVQAQVGRILELPRPIKNKPPRRVVFGFTTLARLLNAKNMLELYAIAPTEQIMATALRRAGIKFKEQYPVSVGAKRYRLDFAIFCKRGSMAIECDNKKAHRGAFQKKKDLAKDINLRRHGWVVVRLGEEEIVLNVPKCVLRIRRTIKKLGGSLF